MLIDDGLIQEIRSVVSSDLKSSNLFAQADDISFAGLGAFAWN
jgi:hypothetical protein